MTDIVKKAAGYVEVKLIPADRTGQTWSGWATRWVDLLVVSEDTKVSQREKIPEIWLEVRKKKSSGKPTRMWTIDAKDTVLYRCTSKTKQHAFGIKFKGKDILYLTGDSETESQHWMNIIRETLTPSDKLVQMEIAAGKLFEASVIDNHYSASCQLFGRYGHLAVCENKLILFDNKGVNVIQEWYLHTIRKLDAFMTNQKDTGKVLSIHLGENSSTGCGVLFLFCPRAILLLETIQHTIKEIFNNLDDDRIVQQASLMSSGALHDISLEEKQATEKHISVSIPDEILKAKERLTEGTRKPQVVEEATDKNLPFIWQDNELYGELPLREMQEKADYTPPDEDEKQEVNDAARNPFVIMTRQRANSCTLELDLPDLKKLKEHIKRRGSLPQPSGRLKSGSYFEYKDDGLDSVIRTARNVLNLTNSEEFNESTETPPMKTIGEVEEESETIEDDEEAGAVTKTDDHADKSDMSAEKSIEEESSENRSQQQSESPTKSITKEEIPETLIEEPSKPKAVSARRGSMTPMRAAPPKPPRPSRSMDCSSDY